MLARFHSKGSSLQLFYRCLSSELVLVYSTKVHFSTGTHDLYPEGSESSSLTLNTSVI